MPTSVENNSLISIYRALDASGTRRLGKWLDSPIHNQRDDVRALHTYLTTGGRLHKTSALAKTRLWKRLFPETPFDDAKLRQTFYWALKTTEEFVAYEHWRQSGQTVQLDLTSGLRSRGLSAETARSLKKAKQYIEQEPTRNERYYRDQYHLELEYDEYRQHHKLLERPRFQQIADTLDLAYLIEKLKASWNMLFHQKLYRTEFDIRFLEEVIGYVKELDLEQHPVLLIHYYGFLGLKEDDASGRIISQLRDAVERHGDLMPRSDLRYVILMAINLCITNMNKGREPYVREAFEWYKLGLEENTIAENGLLTRATYLNIVANAVKLKEYAWAEVFIADYSHQLEEDIRENTERFARARIAYEQGGYKTAMPLLVQVDFKHPVYSLLAKTLLLKIYHELDEYDLLENQIDAMLTYVRRKELSDLHRNNFNNIARLTRQLSRLTPSRGKRKALREKIEGTSPLSEKKWLLEQLDSI